MLVIIYGSTFMGGLDLYNVGRQKVTNFKHTKGAPHSLLVK
ncbi:MAG: hypothetical protein ACLUVG_18140 [Phocaeicola vulgatus]